MSVEIYYQELYVSCDFTSPNLCYETSKGTQHWLEGAGWLFVSNAPYVEEARTYCPKHAKEIQQPSGPAAH